MFRNTWSNFDSKGTCLIGSGIVGKHAAFFIAFQAGFEAAASTREFFLSFFGWWNHFHLLDSLDSSKL